jgi:hypothetical protein
MTKTISQKLRELAALDVKAKWNKTNREAAYEARSWRARARNEWLDELSLDEWRLFCLFVACALESEQ